MVYSATPDQDYRRLKQASKLPRPWRIILLPITMPNFLDTPREVGDLVYVKALYTDQILLGVNEETCFSDLRTTKGFEPTIKPCPPSMKTFAFPNSTFFPNRRYP